MYDAMIDEMIGGLQLYADPGYEVRECVDEFGAEITDGEHSVFIGYFDEDYVELLERLPHCENTLANWQE